jgi:hypothetical protein
MAYATISVVDLISGFRYALDNKWGYIWGTAGVLWTEEKQRQLEKTTDADREQGRKYGSKWIGHYVADCSGLFSYVFKTLGSYMYHGSNTMWNKYCVQKGELKNGKRSDGKDLKPGTAVFTYNEKKNNRGHVGLYIGNGTVIEAAGTKAGVCTSKVTDKKWVEWGELKYVDYPTDENGKEETPVAKEPDKGTYPTLRRGAEGDLVTQLQDLLAKAGSTLQIDGIFGAGTQSAVRAFQSKYGLEVDGIVGSKTWAKLLEVSANVKIQEPTDKPQTSKEYTDAEKLEILWQDYLSRTGNK